MAFQAVTPPAPLRVSLSALMLAAATLLSGIAVSQAQAQTQDRQPSTFAPVIGAALLCHDQLDNAYFYRYLTTNFGAAYKHAGGAYWFRTGEATLWGQPVTEVMVSDDTNELVFIGAVSEVPPDELAAAIRTAAGVAYPAADASRYPLRVSLPGSTIVYYNTKSKIYCAKFKSLPPR
jgi:hypothetical protein